MLPLGNWYGIKDGDPRGRWMLNRHYSANHYRFKHPKLFVGPGEKLVLMTPEGGALFVWRKFIDKSGEIGVNCAVFRNERPDLYLSSDLIREACGIAWQRWPGERLYTYVNAKKIKSSNPGYCFLMAGWMKCERVTASKKLVILEVLPL
jgi:hypothetical protein